MNPQTGEIFELSDNDIEKLSIKLGVKLIPVPSYEIELVKGMNREQRREWARNQKGNADG